MPAQQQILPANEVLKLYAAYLKSETWCIDTSDRVTMAFHAKSGYPANLDHFKINFPKWSKQSGIRVKEGEYEKFLESLKSRLPLKLKSILGTTFRPSPEAFIEVNSASFANTYVPFNPPKPDDYSAPLAEELLSRLFPDAKERKTVLQWLAHIIQEPMIRPQWGLLITGDGGTCKSTLMKLVRLALDKRHWYSRNDYTQALQQFSEVIPDNLVVVFDDAVAGKDTYERLKDTLTRDWQPVELKGKQKLVKREVYSRIAIISNSSRPLRLSEDRRFYAPARCVHPVSAEDSQEFGARLNKWLEDKNTPAILYHWFMEVDLSDFRASGCEKTETLIRMEGASTPALERHIAAFLEEQTVGDQLPIFHERELADFLSAAGLPKCHPDEIARKLTEQGYEESRRPVIKGGKKVPLWQPAGMKRARSLTEAEQSRLQQFAEPTF
jgi:hypothetical protein